MEPALIARVEFFADYSFLHTTELICLEKLMIGGKNFIIFINFWVCEKQFILGLFLAFFGFLSAPYCIHWPFLGLDHFHNLLLSEPVEEIGFICPNNHFFLILKRFCHFWSFFGHYFDLYRTCFCFQGWIFCSYQPLALHCAYLSGEIATRRQRFHYFSLIFEYV